MSRGKLMVLEGLDRTGKTTQCDILINKLKSQGIDAELMKFPARETEIGKLINTYLCDKTFELPDQAIHLLFSANRWEFSQKIQDALNNRKTIVLDRYVYSGIAYSSAKKTERMDLQWCLQPDKGLIKPDLTIFLTNEAGNDDRQGFGDERYEKSEFQKLVKEQFFETFKEVEKSESSTDHLKIIDVTGKNIDQVAESVWQSIDSILHCELQQNNFQFF